MIDLARFGPADRIIDRYSPELEGAEREEARTRLLDFGRVLLSVAMRMVREQSTANDSRKSATEDRIQPSNPLPP